MRDTASKSWRPLGYWALTLNASLGFPAIVILAILNVESIAVVAGAYASILATWALAAGIRQWGKHNGEQ